MSENNERPTAAVVWEITNTEGKGMRIMVAGRFLGYQTIGGASQRPMWTIERHAAASLAAARAVTITEQQEREGGSLLCDPLEVVVHEPEAAALGTHAVIPPPLRARIYTALHRRRMAA